MIKKSLFFVLLHLVFVTAVTSQSNLAIYQSKISKYKYSRHLDSTRLYYKKALKIALKNKDSIAIFNAYKGMGDAYEHHLFRDSTLALYDICEKYIPQNNSKLKSFLLNDRAYTYDLLHDYETAIQLRFKALAIAEKAKNKEEIANIATNLGDSFSKLGLNKQAEQYYNIALTISKNSQFLSLLEYAHRNYGIHLLKIKNIDHAFFNLKLASKYSVKIKDSITMAFAWSNLAACYWSIKKVDSCFYYAKKAEGIWERRVENIDLSAVCMQQAEYYVALSKPDKAEFYLKKAEKFILQDLYFNQKLFVNFAKLYQKKGNTKLAYEYLLKAKNCLEQINENEKKSKLAVLSVKFDTENKEKQIFKSNKRNEIVQLKLERKSFQVKFIVVILVFLIIIGAILIKFYLKIKFKNIELFESNIKLEDLVNQKRMLLKEIHHRVKNNLTTLKSLLFLQSKATDNDEVKAILNESQQRIHSMALIHQNLYEDAEAEFVDFYNFIKNLFLTVESVYKTPNKNIKVTFSKTNLNLEMSTAIYLGLVLNELATNSYKYAFATKDSGKINVALYETNNEIKVIYSDNGLGLKTDFESNTSGFGFKLIRILVQQINAKIEYKYEKELSVFTITIANE